MSKYPKNKEIAEFFIERWERYVDEEWGGKIPKNRAAELMDAFYHGGEATFDLLKKYVRPKKISPIQ